MKPAVMIGIAASSLALAVAWFGYPITLPADHYEVVDFDADQISDLKMALAEADVSRNSDTRGSLSGPGYFSLDCGGLPIADVWDFGEATRISISTDAKQRFPSAMPAIRTLDSAVGRHRGKRIIDGVRRAPLSAIDRFVLKYRDGKDVEIGC